MPQKWKQSKDQNNISFVHSSTGGVFDIDETVSVEIDGDLPQELAVHFLGIPATVEKRLVNKEDLEKLIKDEDKMTACNESGIDNKRHWLCYCFTLPIHKSCHIFYVLEKEGKGRRTQQQIS